MDYSVKKLSDYSDDSLLNELRKVAEQLGKTPTQRQFGKLGRASAKVYEDRFGSWNNALKKAGLAIQRSLNIPEEELFSEIEKVWNQLGKQPTGPDTERLGRFARSTYEKRFGGWIKALEEFAKWKNKNGVDVDSSKDLQKISPDILPNQQKQPHRAKKVEYGEPIDFLGLRHAPLNEQGVVYLFGMLSRQLGFVIEAVKTDFPDCEGKREIRGKKGKWERVAIEFEYRSSNFKEHGHNPDECDVIVCWEHDWKECPLEVISLKEIMKKIKE